MIQIPQSTSRVVMLKVFLSSDHVTAATGKTVAVTISKNGGAFGNPNAGATSATEVANGWYKVTLDTTDTNTVGDLAVRGTCSGCDDAERVFGVVSATSGGLTNLDAAISTRSTYAGGDTSGTTTLLSRIGGSITISGGAVNANLVSILGTALTETAGLLAAGFKKFFNIATPANTLNDLATASALSSVATAVAAVPTAAANAATTFTAFADTIGVLANDGNATMQLAKLKLICNDDSDGALHIENTASGGVGAKIIGDNHGLIAIATSNSGAGISVQGDTAFYLNGQTIGLRIAGDGSTGPSVKLETTNAPHESVSATGVDISGAISGVLLADGGLDNVLDDIAGAVTITPVYCTVSPGEVLGSQIVGYTNTPQDYVFVVVDSTGAAINLTGKTCKLSVSLTKDSAALYSIGGTVGGTDHNQVTVSIGNTRNPTAGAFHFNLRNTTDGGKMLGRGTYRIDAEPIAI